jgi:Glycine rich protein
MPTPAGRHRRPGLRRSRRGLRAGLACVLASGGVVLLADPVSAATEIPCQPAGQQIQCTTSDPTQPYQFTVPAGLTSAQLDLLGGEGGQGGVEVEDLDRSFVAAQGGLEGGAGGFTSVPARLTSGEVLQIYIGGPGGNGNGCRAGSGGVSGGTRTGGDGGDACSAGTAGGGGGGGGTFVLTRGTPTSGTPLAVAGGGGGGAGSDGNGSATGGRGGGNASGPSQPGNPPGPGGASGDQQPNLNGVGSNGADADCGGYRSSSVGSTADCEYGGGGGGGGHFAGHGGDPAGGGGGGSGFPATSSSAGIQRSASAFHAAQVGGSFTITFTPPPATTRPHGGGPSSNDPNPNTNPPRVSPGDVSRTTTASCEPRVGVCHVGPIVGPDSVFNVTARAGNTHADLFGTLTGGSRPDCPNYTEMNVDWLAFGFLDAKAGSSWRKLSTLTTRHKLSRPAAVALSRQMQICFEAPYRFLTRHGYALGGHNAVFDGVLPDCTAIGERTAGGVTRPCLASRQVLSRHGGWVVRLAFRVPANSRDPKALG